MDPKTTSEPTKPVTAPQTLEAGLEDTTGKDDWESNVEAFDNAGDDSTIVGSVEDSAPVQAQKVETPAAPVSPVVTEQVTSPAVPAPQQVEVPAPVEVSTPASAAAVPPPQVAPSVPPVVTQPQVTQVPPQQPQQQAAPAAEAPEPDLSSVARQLQENQLQVVDALAKAHYGLSAEEMDSINVNPGEAIPKLLARVHVNAVSATLQHVGQQLPRMMLGMMEARRISEEAEGRFYTSWPQLNKATHGAAVQQIARVYRQMNPNAKPEDFIKHVGAQAVVALGLLQPTGNAPTVQAPAPQRPYVPAAVSAPAGRGPAAPQNLFEQLDQMLLSDDS